MSTSTLVATINTAISTFWDYLTPTISPLVVFVVTLGVLSLGVYFVLKRIRVLG